MKRKEKEFVCEMCGNSFVSTATSAHYCPECRKKRKNMSTQKYKNKVASGEKIRKVGEMQICEVCGNDFVLKTGSQRICDNCREEYQKIKRREYNKNNSVGIRNFNKENYDSFLVYFEKGKKDKLKEVASRQDLSLNLLINNAIDCYLDSLGEKK